MTRPLRVLIVEDRPEDAELMAAELRRGGYAPAWTRAENEAEYLAALVTAPDVILADYTLPQFGATRALDLLVPRGLDIPFIVVTGTIGEDAAVECVKKGAADYILKDRMTRLASAVNHALAEHALRAEQRRVMALVEQRESELREAQRVAHVGSWRWNTTTGVRFWSEEFRRIYGLEPTEEPDAARDHTPESATRLVQAVRRTLRSYEPWELDLELIRPSGEHRWVTTRGEVTRDGAGHVDGLQGTAMDITERHRADKARRARAHQQAAVLRLGQRALGDVTLPNLLREATHLVAQTLAVDGAEVLELTAASDALRLCAGVGWSAGLIGSATVDNRHELLTGYVLESGAPVVVDGATDDDGGRWPTLLRDRGIVSGMWVAVGPPDQRFGILGAHSARECRFTSDEVDFLQVIANTLGAVVERDRAIQAFAESEARLKVLATVDALTGIANRREFTRLLDAEIRRSTRYGAGLALVMCDVDHFKQVNDTFGHLVGDGVLREITAVAIRCVRSVDTIARWGGEEFMVLLPQADLPAARCVAEKLRAAIEDHAFETAGSVTISCGGAALAPDEDSNSLLTRVDNALYAAKAGGRNRIECPDRVPRPELEGGTR